jgi:hypothetical protein
MKYGALVTKTIIESGGYGNEIKHTELIHFQSKEDMSNYVDAQYRSMVKSDFVLIEFNELTVTTSITVKE